MVRFLYNHHHPKTIFIVDEPTIRDLYERLGRIEENLKTLHMVIDTFQQLYVTLDARVRTIEAFMYRCDGGKSAQAPIWDMVKNAITSVVIGIIMLCLGFAAGKN